MKQFLAGAAVVVGLQAYGTVFAIWNRWPEASEHITSYLSSGLFWSANAALLTSYLVGFFWGRQ